MGRRKNKMRLIVVRHGKDDERYRGGWSSFGLVEEGRKQAENLANFLQHSGEFRIERIISSDLKRAMETAEYLSSALDLPISSEPQLREMDNGDLAGLLHEEALKKYPGLFFNTLGMDEAYPNGESPLAFYQRIQTWFEQFFKNTKNQENDILVVTHGGVINILYHLVKGLEWTNKTASFPTKNCSIHVLNCRTMEFEAENQLVD